MSVLAASSYFLEVIGTDGFVVFVSYFIFCLSHIIYLAVLVNRNVSHSVSSSGQDPRIPVRNQVPLYSVAKKLPPASCLSTASWRCPQNCLFVRLMLSICLQSSAGRYETCDSSPWSSSPSILQPLTVPANFGIKTCSAKSLSGAHIGSWWLLHSTCSWSCSNAMLFSPVSSSYRMCMCFSLTCIIFSVPLVPLGPVKQWDFTALRNNLPGTRKLHGHDNCLVMLRNRCSRETKGAFLETAAVKVN